MAIHRRRFLKTTAMVAGGAAAGYFVSGSGNEVSDSTFLNANGLISAEQATVPVTHSVTPIVGDGRWIWTKPPAEQTGYLEPRIFKWEVKMTFTGTGPSSELYASTVLPCAYPEQVDLQYGADLEKHGVGAESTVWDKAGIVPYGNTAKQFVLYTPKLGKGQVSCSKIWGRFKISKNYQGYKKEQFPIDQGKASKVFGQQYLNNSPGIRVKSGLVTRLAKSIVTGKMHPWDKAKKFHDWVWNNIKGIPGNYTSVETAIQKKRGDCEERASTFIALCRSVGIPARTVLVPGHAWAEFGLINNDNVAHWIPAHTAAYSWFGWTGAHELVLQKGDNFYVKNRKKKLRLIDDWYHVQGARPKAKFEMSIAPVDENGDDPGPGARKKADRGRWVLTGNHRDNKWMRGD